MPKKILLVDDEPEILEICRDYLKASGYNVVTAKDGTQGLSAARREKPDLVVLDLMLPEMDGLDVCRAIRRESNVPIIMLTARVEETDKLVGLEIGADDYMTKPFSPRELVARVRVVLRRVSGDSAAQGVAFESYERAIDSHIRNLRHKLEPDGLIITVHGVGYKFEA